MNSKNVTIYDIAKEAGVSPATVSRVLTKNARVRSDKKEKVEKLIEKYNFRPNALARGLSDTRRNVIGIIAADIRNIFYAEVFVACEEAANKAGYTVLLLNSFGELETEKNQLSKLMEQRVDAIIQLGGAVDDLVSNEDYAEQVNLVMNSIPVIVTGKLDGTPCYQVRIDVMKAMDMIVQHLVENGNYRIALVGGEKDVVSSYDKYQRLKQLEMKYRLEYRKEYTENWSSYDVDGGRVAMENLIQKVKAAGIEMPDAIIAINDQVAVGALKYIQNKGYHIPEDISLVSFDNVQVTEIVEPNISSIDYGYSTFGETLVQTAIDAIEGKDVNRLQFVEPNLVIRRSSDYKRKKEEE